MFKGVKEVLDMIKKAIWHHLVLCCLPVSEPVNSFISASILQRDLYQQITVVSFTSYLYVCAFSLWHIANPALYINHLLASHDFRTWCTLLTSYFWAFLGSCENRFSFLFREDLWLYRSFIFIVVSTCGLTRVKPHFYFRLHVRVLLSHFIRLLIEQH